MSAWARRPASARSARARLLLRGPAWCGPRGAPLIGVVLAAALLASGCEEPGQRGARRALQAHLRMLPGDGGYRPTDVHCTRAARYAYVQAVRTRRYFCIARLESGGCDLFRVDARRDGSAAVALVRRDAGCILPA